MAIISYADAYKKHLEEQKNADKKDIGLTRKYSLESGSDPGADIILGTLFMNPAKIARGVASATGKETSEGAKKALGWASMPGAKVEQGFFGAAEGITDFLAGGAAQIAGQKDAAKWIYEHSWSREAVGADVTDEFVGDAAESKGYQIASDLLSGVGNVGFQIAVGTLIGGALAAPVANGAISQAGARAISFAPLFASASGAGTAENIAKTGELGWRENVGGLLKGGVEVLTEVISPTGKIVDRAINGKSAGSIFRYLSKHAVAKNIIVDFASEAGEEMASYAGGWFIENKLKISDEAFSARDMLYQGVLGGITGAIFAAPTDISLVRSARSAGAKVYAQGDAAVKNKINEGLIEVAALKERGLNNDNVKLAEAALAKLTTDENLSQTTKEYYLGLAEQMVLKQNLSDQYNALAKELVAKAKADPATAQSMADAFNALVNEAGGEGKYTAADFTNENSEAARIYVVAQMANDWLSRSDAEIATDEIMRRKAALYQGTAEQKNAIRSMEDGSTVAFRVGENAYAVVTKRAGTDTYSVGFTTPGQVESDGTVVATHNLTAEKVEEMLAKPMTEQGIDAQIAENAAKKAEAEAEKTEKESEKKSKQAEKKQTEKPKRKTAEKKSESKETAPAKPVSEETKKESAERTRYRKYEEIRKEHPDSVVAMRRGDFYIVYGNDATEIAKRTQLKLLKLSVDGELVPAVAIPYEDARTYFDYIEGKVGEDVIVVTPNGKVQNRGKSATDTSLSPAKKSEQTEQTAEQAQTEAKKVAPEDLSTVEKRLTSAFGIDGSEFTKEEWTKARECVPNIDGLNRREQARVLTLVRTAQARGVNEAYMKGLARLSSVYGFGVVFEDIDVSGFYSRKHGMVVINPKNLDETFGHEIKHTFDQVIKDGNAEFREDLSAKVKKIVGASVFEKARAQYKADYEKLRARDGSVAEMSDAELDAESSANVVGKYLSNMTLLKKLAATDYSLGRGLLAAIRRMKDKWTSVKAFAKENDSTTFAEYRKMTRIERLLMQELNKAKNAKQTGTEAPSGENISYSPGEWDEGRGRGYDGYSMSNNARDAYASGEKPLSKWTKADILDAVEEIAPDKVDLVKTVSVRVLKANLLYRSSWHHTSEYYNRTDFYSVNDDLLENLTKEDVKRWVENTAKESQAEQTRKYRGDIHYLEWGGTRNHPRATEQTLKNVNIEERGSFYIVTDDNGKELLRKKIGSNGTYVTDYEYEARLERQRQAAKDAEDNNSTEAARALFKKWTGKDKISERGFGIGIEESRSGNIYKYGRKPGSWQYDHLDDFFEKGEQRLSKNENGGYFVETWDGEKWVAEAKKTNGGVSYSPSPVTRETDSRYLELARDPQKNESELRRLVKEAAEQWGAIKQDNAPKVFYHGTSNEFWAFDILKSNDKTGRMIGLGSGKGKIYLTEYKASAQAAAYSSKARGTGKSERVLPLYVSANKVLDKTDYSRLLKSAYEKYPNSEPHKTGYDYTQRDKAIAEVDRYVKKQGYDCVWDKESGEMFVFNSTQLKSADPVTYDDSGNIIPLSERFNPQNNDIRYSPASTNGSGRIVIQASQSRPTGREKLTNLKGELSRSNFRAALESLQVIAVNAQQGVENQLVRAGLTKREAAAFSQLARSGRSHAINAICYKLADMTGAIRSEGLIPILEPFLATKGEVYPAVDKDGNTVQSTAKGGELAGKRYSEFSDYYAMLHAIDRDAVGKNPYSSMTVAQMKQIVAEYEQKNPDFKTAAEKLSAFNSAMLDIEVQAGIISQETADLWRKQYPHYVPMYTQDSNAVGGKPVRGARNMEVRRDNKAATESDHRVSDPLRNYIDQTQRRIRAAKLNILLNEVYNSADGVNVVTAEADKAQAKDLREREQAYLENPESENDPAEMFRKFKRGKNTVNEVSFYKDGKRVTMAVTDRIYTGLSDLGGIHSSILDSWTVKAVKKVNDTFKKLVTNWNPFFAVKNIARDLQDGTLQSRFGMGEFLNMYRKNAEMMATGKYNDMWEEFLANGGLESSLYSDEFGTFTKGGKSGLEQATGIVGQFQHIKNFNTLTEALPRFTEFCLTLKHGGTIQQAIYNAADVTVNFGRSGTLIRILNSTVSPFLNPAVQGLDRVIRLFTEDGIKNNKALASLLLKAVLLAIVPMALGNAMYGNDDEYKDMKDSVKENNYLFKIGDTWLKLPRGRVVSTISGLFNRSYKQLTGQETDWVDYGKNVLDQITPVQNVARHIGSPFYDVANNRTWYGTKIESDALQNYAVNQRYDENTSRISVWIGQLTSHFGLSPKEVNYLIDQYTGVVGDILLPTTTPAGTKGVVSYNFTVDPNTSSNLSNRFYDLYNKTMYKSNDGDVEAYYLKKRLDETKSAVSELFKEIKAINASTELSNKEKVKQASAIRASINQLYKTALDDRRLYEQNIKDALAIENSYAVEQITAQSAKRYGLDSDAVGKYALTFGGDFAKQFNTEAQANDYKADASKKTVYAEANRLTYGSEYALREYNSNVYEKAQKLNELGISYDEYYNYYMTARYYSGKTKKQKILAYLNGSGLSKSQIALMMYYSGYTAYADEAKKAIKASSLSAERKKELLAGITN